MNRFVVRSSLALFAPLITPDFSISSYLLYDTRLEFSSAGCHYDAHITGTLTPVYSRVDQGQDVEPNFDISANLSCPRMAPVHIEKHLEHTGPVTRERVETLLSHQATITREDTEKRCLHIPTFRFHGESLVGVSIEMVCTRPPS